MKNLKMTRASEEMIAKEITLMINLNLLFSIDGIEMPFFFCFLNGKEEL